MNSLYKKNCVTLIAGPCAIETKDQLDAVSSAIKELGLKWMRGGAFKPRTSPYSFQGYGDKAVALFSKIAHDNGLYALTEIVDSSQLPLLMPHVDALQIGTRNMTNFELLKSVGKACSNGFPILFKRGMAATIKEWLTAAEYFVQEKNSHIMLCERGIRTFEPSTRFTLDISAIPLVKQLSTYPICVDVSHAAGKTSLIVPLAKASIAAGADAIMIEVHPNPRKAKSDAAQQLSVLEFKKLVSELRVLVNSMGKSLI